MMLVFIPWDVAFTEYGIWGFNQDYLCGWEWLGLPIEEWLFFVVVPYAMVFIYECLLAYFPSFRWSNVNSVFIVLSVLLIILGLVFYDKWYTFVNFLGAGILLSVVSLLPIANKSFWLLAYGVGWLPFFVVNGILTGTGIDHPVVWYNDQENLSFRLGTIPVEDLIYLLFFFFLVLVVYEKQRSKAN